MLFSGSVDAEDVLEGWVDVLEPVQPETAIMATLASARNHTLSIWYLFAEDGYIFSRILGHPRSLHILAACINYYKIVSTG